ncbi:MAG: ATP-dependent Clp protease proteolytic subunit [Synergistaceae bacterium]
MTQNFDEKTIEQYVSEEVDCLPMVCNISLEEKFILDDLDERYLFINDEIDSAVAEHITYHIIRFNKEDKGLARKERKPILIFICTPGGSVSDGFRIIDSIQASSTPIYTVNTGYWYSIGLLIGMAGDKRYGTKNSSYLMHDGHLGSFNSTSKVIDEMKFYDALEYRIKEYTLTNTSISDDAYQSHSRIEWYMFSEEAKSMGVIDEIINEDIKFEDLL